MSVAKNSPVLNQRSFDDTESGTDDDSFIWEPTKEIVLNNSQNSQYSPKRSQNKCDSTRTPVLNYTAAKQKDKLSTPWFLSICAVFLMVGTIYYFPNKHELSTCSFEELRKNNLKQPDLVWRHLSVGIENILNKIKDMPAVYLFVHEESTIVNKLIKDIAKESSACFGQKMNPVEMQADDFQSERTINDYGYAIEKYKQKIKEGQVILIANLNEIPAEAARALHTICDVQSPIVKNVVIFLTLTVPSLNSADTPLRIAEDTLVELWGDKLDRNELDPLITRVTDQVIQLKR